MPESRIDDLNPEQLRAATAGEGPVLTICRGGRHGQDQDSCVAGGLARVAGDPSGPDYASHVPRRASDEMLRRARRALGETESRTLGTVWGDSRDMLEHGVDVGSPCVAQRGLAKVVALDFRYDGGEGKYFEHSALEGFATSAAER